MEICVPSLIDKEWITLNVHTAKKNVKWYSDFTYKIA